MISFDLPDSVDPNTEPMPPLSDDGPRKKSPHYLQFILRQTCAACTAIGAKQQDRTTAHHIRPAGMAMKCPDFLTMPVEYRRHVMSEGRESLDQMGKVDWLVHHKLPEYERIVLFYLAIYLVNGWYKRPLTREGKLGRVETVFPDPQDGPSALFYYNQILNDR